MRRVRCTETVDVEVSVRQRGDITGGLPADCQAVAQGRVSRAVATCQPIDGGRVEGTTSPFPFPVSGLPAGHPPSTGPSPPDSPRAGPSRQQHAAMTMRRTEVGFLLSVEAASFPTVETLRRGRGFVSSAPPPSLIVPPPSLIACRGAAVLHFLPCLCQSISIAHNRWLVVSATLSRPTPLVPPTPSTPVSRVYRHSGD